MTQLLKRALNVMITSEKIQMTQTHAIKMNVLQH